MPSDKYWSDKTADSHLARLDVKKQNKKELQGFLHLFDSPPPPDPASQQFTGKKKKEREASAMFACSLCVSNSASRVDVIFQTAHQCVYVLGARKFFSK